MINMVMPWGWWCVVSAACVAAAAQAAGPGRQARLVATAQGPVRGYLAAQQDHYEFFGIPYATAPTGPLRFTGPLPAPVWLETLEAVNDSIICPQSNLIKHLAPNKVMEENCLIANIYVPDTEKKNLPVLVIVHGGGYQVGFGNFMTPRGLMKSKKVIAVTFNYRLGVHGFLCLGTNDAPGNAGMKDQVALLRWVRKNIKQFGGNPDDVTITGSSAGGSSVDLLMLSDLAKGLFNKVIPESGSNVAVWSVQIDPHENAKYYANELGFMNIDDVNALEEFYKNAPYDLLFSNSIMDGKDSTFGLGPCVERYTGTEAFLSDSPVNIIKQSKYRKVPVLYGFANMEGLLRLVQFENWQNEMNTNFTLFLPSDLQFDNEQQRAQVAKAVKEFYFGDKAVNQETVLNFVDYFSDVTFAYPALRSVSLQVAAGSKSIYLYEYSYPVEVFAPYYKPPGEIPEYMSKIRGARHTAQTDAVLECSLGEHMEHEDSEAYRRHKELMKELWLNFITTGKPVGPGAAAVPGLESWSPAGDNCSPHASLGERMEMRGALLEARRKFWDGIYAKHYRAPAPPPPPPPPPLPARHTEL
ncbi:esterase E4-like [Leguminivora glycinivorella]|uniref:esterase E4-like n=1 Tax=Leguminivora glycinivorella TaxID=1035111 RepID=UPI00200E131A|nr:esterase E4-like [Leguminivora glycinivorella]XP_048004506.1 esterase E4-like [Leguminivora glycinivorella]